MLDQRRRRRPNINTTMGRWHLFAGIITSYSDVLLNLVDP